MNQKNIINIYQAGLAAVQARQAVLNHVQRKGEMLLVNGDEFQLSNFSRIVVIGAGKATAQMAQAVEELLGDHISAGHIVVKYEHTAPLKIIRQTEAAHPVPDAAGVNGTRQMLQLLEGLDEKSLVLCLLSGGASALMAAPAKGLTLSDKQQVTSLLLAAGASINELNAVRKHLSAVKGGRLLQAAAPATVMALILSDVIGNPLDVIASGPTSADASSYADALAVIEKYSLADKLPAAALTYLQQGLAQQHAETLKQNDTALARTRNVIVGSIDQALRASQTYAQQQGLHAEIITAALQGEAKDAANKLARHAIDRMAQLHPGEALCLLSGGETTVTVQGNGLGGRNQELALAFAREIAGTSGIQLLSAGTDGTDGPTDAAGAMVDGNTVPCARKAGLDPEKFLANHDSWHFFAKLDAVCGTHAHYVTGPTGTNVMDMQIIILEKVSS